MTIWSYIADEYSINFCLPRYTSSKLVLLFIKYCSVPFLFEAERSSAKSRDYLLSKAPCQVQSEELLVIVATTSYMLSK